MQVILDQPIIQEDHSNVNYAGIWPRFGALIIDGIVTAPITVGLTYLNVMLWHSLVGLVLVAVVSIAYKPLMEVAYGATLGKMALRIKVTDRNFEKADFGTILLRNIFNIVPSAISLVLMVVMYKTDGFEVASGVGGIGGINQEIAADQVVTLANAVITIVDAVMLANDDQKRSLHDRIAGTFVIVKG